MKLIICFSALMFLIGSASCNPGNFEGQTDTGMPTNETQEKEQDPNQIILDDLLAQIKKATNQLTSCQADLSYFVIQDPDLLNSKTLRKGTLYYLKQNNRGNLRIRFDTIKQDDFEPEKQRQEYLFDGVWLKRIDYKLEQIDLNQQAPENKPIDVFNLIKHHFPLVGFSDDENLTTDFDISLVSKSNDPNDTVRLLMKVKENSAYEKDYRYIYFWVDINTYLPKRVEAYSAQGDVYDIQFDRLEPNKYLKNTIFTIETPSHFRKNIEKLEENPKRKGN